MAIPKGTRTSRKKQEKQTSLPAVKIICKITGTEFSGYKGQLPISKEGWVKLTDEQKYKISWGDYDL